MPGTLLKRGRFITLEGVEGAGKSTSLSHVTRLLSESGIQVTVTREPGGTTLGEEVRTLLLSHREEGINEDSELLLMFAARAEHVARVIRPALARGEWVLCDRFTDASCAYQGGGRGIAPHRIRTLQDWVLGDFAPDLTLLLDLPVAAGLKRAGARSNPDRFELEQASFFERVRTTYLEIAGSEPARVRVIDALRPRAAVEAQISEVLMGFIGSLEK